MKRCSWVAILLALLLAGCASPHAAGDSADSPRTLVVFAASSLTQAFEQLGTTFEAQHPGVKVTFDFGGSQALVTQIEQGAPADVMVSADAKQMDALIAGGYVSQARSQPFVTNRLVVILPASNPAYITKLQDLSRPNLKLVLAASDVPVGSYSRRSLANMDMVFGSGFSAAVLANVVSNEDNVKQVVAKVQLGEADAGIVYTSDAVAAPQLKTIEIPPSINIVAKYAIAPLSASHQLDVAQAFVDYVRSQEAQAVLAKWGFGPLP